MLKKLLTAATIAAMPVVAHAADVATKAPPRFAPAPVAYNWTGFYIGANAGYGLGNVVIDDKDCNISCSSQTLSPNGFTAGGTIGYNWQFGSTVLGIEGDWNWIDAKKTIDDPDWPSQHRAEIKSFGTVRARAGLALDRTLLYLTGGVGFVNQNVHAIITEPCTSQCGFSKSDTKAGLAVGAGAEFALSGPWTAKAEYLYINVPADNSIPDVLPNFTSDQYNVKTDLHVVRAGLNYRFWSN
jgi:outer membrane immunogenic protein